MPFVVIHGGENAALGAGLGAVGSNIAQGMAMKPELDLAREKVKAYQEGRAAQKALAEAQSGLLTERMNAGDITGQTHTSQPDAWGFTAQVQGPDPHELEFVKQTAASLKTPEAKQAFLADFAQGAKHTLADQAISQTSDQLATTMRAAAKLPGSEPFQERLNMLAETVKAIGDPNMPPELRNYYGGIVRQEHAQIQREMWKHTQDVMQEEQAHGALQTMVGQAPPGSLEAKLYSGILAGGLTGGLSPKQMLAMAARVPGKAAEVQQKAEEFAQQQAVREQEQARLEQQNQATQLDREQQKALTAAGQAEAARHNKAMEEKPRGGSAGKPFNERRRAMIDQGMRTAIATYGNLGDAPKPGTPEYGALRQQVISQVDSDLAAGNGAAPAEQPIDKRSQAIQELRSALQAKQTKAQAQAIAAKYGFKLEDFKADELK